MDTINATFSDSDDSLSQRLRESINSVPMASDDVDSEIRVLRDAERLITQDRRNAYRAAELNFQDIAVVWSVILDRSVRADQVGLMLAGLKIVRAAHREDVDDLSDGCGYLALTQRVRDRINPDNVSEE